MRFLFNWERVGFNSRWVSAVIYLKRESYEVWLFGYCWMNVTRAEKRAMAIVNHREAAKPVVEIPWTDGMI